MKCCLIAIHGHEIHSDDFLGKLMGHESRHIKKFMGHEINSDDFHGKSMGHKNRL